MCRICTDPLASLVDLTELNCYNCPLLTSIPPTLVGLTHLNCAGCPLLTSIPPELVNLTTLFCHNCPWLVQNAAVYPLRLPAVSRIQTWFKRGKRQAFKRYIRTRAFNEWFWAGDAAGGRVHKRHMEWTMKRRKCEK